MASFLELLMASPEVKPLLSSEHFSVDGTLLRAWASHGSLVRIDGSDDDPPPPSGGNGFGTGGSKGKKQANSQPRRRSVIDGRTARDGAGHRRRERDQRGSTRLDRLFSSLLGHPGVGRAAYSVLKRACCSR